MDIKNSFIASKGKKSIWNAFHIFSIKRSLNAHPTSVFNSSIMLVRSILYHLSLGFHDWTQTVDIPGFWCSMQWGVYFTLVSDVSNLFFGKFPRINFLILVFRININKVD